VLFDTKFIEIGSVSVIENCFSFSQRAFALQAILKTSNLSPFAPLRFAKRLKSGLIL